MNSELNANKKALTAAEAISQMLEEICSPLFSNFDINNFGYVKVYNDGRMLRLSTNHEWTKKYFEGGFYNDIDFYAFEKIPIGATRKVFVDGTPQGEHFSALYDHNIWNILIIYERQRTYGNVWFFATTREQTQIMDFYLNNSLILERFILYFKEKTHHIIKAQEEQGLIITSLHPFKDLFYKKNTVEFHTNLFDIKRLYLERKPNSFYFTKCEFNCLRHLSKNKTISETARLESISPKTVETHLKNMKAKSGSHCTSKLIELFYEECDFYI